MDTSEKIKVFKSFEELTQEIIRDKESHDMLAQRYAVRFIMLNNFNEFKELAKFMANIGVQSLDLENLIDDGEDDTWITKDMLKNAIKACTVSTFVTPSLRWPASIMMRISADSSMKSYYWRIYTIRPNVYTYP